MNIYLSPEANETKTMKMAKIEQKKNRVPSSERDKNRTDTKILKAKMMSPPIEVMYIHRLWL